MKEFIVGEILKVKTNSGTEWYEVVIQDYPEIVTRSIVEDGEEASTQLICENFEYTQVTGNRLLSLLTGLTYGEAFSIANRYYGSDYSLQRKQFEKALRELRASS